MRGTSVALGLLLLLAPQGFAAEAPTFQFSTPAQVGGNLEAHNPSWALVVLSSGMDAAFGLDGASALTLWEYERVIAGEFRVQNNSFGGWVEEIKGTDSRPLPERVQMEARPEGPVSFYIEADRLLASLEGTAAAIEVPPGTCVDFLLAGDDDAGHGARPDALCPGTWPAVVARPAAGTSLRFKLEGQEASRVQWHNMATHCPNEADCPSGGSQQTDTVPISSTDYVRNRRHVFEEATGPASATATGWGEAKVVVFGGTSIDLAVDGWMRLPLASSDAGCASCLTPSNQTFSATGNMTLVALHAVPGGRLGGTISGDFVSARFDEATIDPAALTGEAAAVAAATAVGLVLFLKFVLVPLFTRHRDADLLANERRRRIHDFVVRNPGVHFRELLRGTGVPAGSGRYHVNRLIQGGLLLERRQRSSLRLFENHPRFKDTWQDWAALRDPNLRRLHEWLAEHPDSKQKDIRDAFLQMHGWSSSTTQARLGRLVRDGVAQVRTQGRGKHYSAAKAGVAMTAVGQQVAVPTSA